MTHIDPDLLALAALGEAVPDDAAEHFEGCVECRAERDAFAHAADIGRAVRPDDLDLPAPPVAVWEGISAELGLAAAVTDAAAPDATVRGIDDAPSARRRRGGRVWWAVAAAVVVFALIAGGIAVGLRDSGGNAPIREIALNELSESGATGRAALVKENGAYALEVDTSGLRTRPGEYFELWVMNPDTNSIVSLGAIVPGSRSTHPLPPGVTTVTDPFVDISAEPLDGDPGHSKVSVLRGQFA